MKYLILLLFLTGCGITPSYIKKAEKVCLSNDGLASINFRGKVKCNNGVIVDLEYLKELPEKKAVTP